jgi:hypothetical protein
LLVVDSEPLAVEFPAVLCWPLAVVPRSVEASCACGVLCCGAVSGCVCTAALALPLVDRTVSCAVPAGLCFPVLSLPAEVASTLAAVPEEEAADATEEPAFEFVPPVWAARLADAVDTVSPFPVNAE